MFVMVVSDLDLGPDVQHKSTDWQIALDPLFKNVILESLNDSENKLIKIFNEPADPRKKYYGRSRILLSTGYTEWSNIDVFYAEDVDELDALADIPSRASSYVLTTDSDVNNHVPTLFTMSIPQPSIDGTATHVATNWFIENMNGDIIWKKLKSDNKLSILVDDLILKPNQVYRLRASVVLSSGDVSNVTSITIFVPDEPRIKIIKEVIDPDINQDYDVLIFKDPRFTSVTYKLYTKDNNTIYKLTEHTDNTSNMYRFTIPSSM